MIISLKCCWTTHTHTHTHRCLFVSDHVWEQNTKCMSVKEKWKFVRRWCCLLGRYNFMTVDKSQIVVERVNTGNFDCHCLKSFCFFGSLSIVFFCVIVWREYNLSCSDIEQSKVTFIFVAPKFTIRRIVKLKWKTKNKV